MTYLNEVINFCSRPNPCFLKSGTVQASVEFKDGVVVGGQAGFAGHLTVGEGAKIAGQTGITKDVAAGAFLKGNPALPFHLFQRLSILQKRLPEMFNRFDAEVLKE